MTQIILHHAIFPPFSPMEELQDPRVKHPATEGASEPLARLADMDAMGAQPALSLVGGNRSSC